MRAVHAIPRAVAPLHRLPGLRDWIASISGRGATSKCEDFSRPFPRVLGEASLVRQGDAEHDAAVAVRVRRGRRARKRPVRGGRARRVRLLVLVARPATGARPPRPDREGRDGGARGGGGGRAAWRAWLILSCLRTGCVPSSSRRKPGSLASSMQRPIRPPAVPGQARDDVKPRPSPKALHPRPARAHGTRPWVPVAG